MAIISDRRCTCFKTGSSEHVSGHDGQICNHDRWIHFDFELCQTVVSGGIVLWICSCSEHVMVCPGVGKSYAKIKSSLQKIEKFFRTLTRYQAARDVR